MWQNVRTHIMDHYVRGFVTVQEMIVILDPAVIEVFWVWIDIVILKHIIIGHTHIYRLVNYFYFLYFKSSIFYDRSMKPPLLKKKYGLFQF